MTARKKPLRGTAERLTPQILRLAKDVNVKLVELREPVFTGADIKDLSGAIGKDLAPSCRIESVAADLNLMLEVVGNMVLERSTREQPAVVKRRWEAIEGHADAILEELRWLRYPTQDELRRLHPYQFEKIAPFLPGTKPPASDVSSDETAFDYESMMKASDEVSGRLIDVRDWEKWISTVAGGARRMAEKPPLASASSEKIEQVHYGFMLNSYRHSFGKWPLIYLDSQRDPDSAAVKWCVGIRSKALARLPSALATPWPEMIRFFLDSREPSTMAEKIRKALSAIKNVVAAAAKPK